MDGDVSWRAGTASEIVTPDEPLWLAGYAARTAPAREKISDLHASALTLDDGAGGCLVIASIDLIAITKIIADRVYEAVHREIGLPRERIVLAATHTHYGPEFRPDKALFFNIPREFAAKIEPTAHHLADALSRIIIESTRNMEPVTLSIRHTTSTFAHNRRRAGVKGGEASAEDVLDQDVPVLSVNSADSGRPKSIVFGYACHNTTIPPEDGRYCADWAGFAKEKLRNAFPGATPLFITGCGADQNPEPRGSVELSREYGHQLADAVQKSVEDDGQLITGPLGVAIEDVPLALEPITREQLDANLASDDPPRRVKAKFLLDTLQRGEPIITSYPAPIQAIRFGDELLMIVMSGEPVVDWSLKFKREFAGAARNVWVAGYCNRRIQREGGYEGGRANLWSWVPAPFTNDVEDRVTDAVRRLVAKVS